MSKALASLLKISSSRYQPPQIATAVAAGVITGFAMQSPVIGLALSCLCWLLPIHLPIYMACTTLAFMYAGQLEIRAGHLGSWLLTQSDAAPLMMSFQSMPYAPWLRLHNTVVVGSVIVGFALSVPVYAATLLVVQAALGRQLDPQRYARRRRSCHESTPLVAEVLPQGALGDERTLHEELNFVETPQVRTKAKAQVVAPKKQEIIVHHEETEGLSPIISFPKISPKPETACRPDESTQAVDWYAEATDEQEDHDPSTLQQLQQMLSDRNNVSNQPLSTDAILERANEMTGLVDDLLANLGAEDQTPGSTSDSFPSSSDSPLESPDAKSGRQSGEIRMPHPAESKLTAPDQKQLASSSEAIPQTDERKTLERLKSKDNLVHLNPAESPLADTQTVHFLAQKSIAESGEDSYAPGGSLSNLLNHLKENQEKAPPNASQ